MRLRAEHAAVGVPQQVGQRTGGVVAVRAGAKGLEGDLDVRAPPRRRRRGSVAGGRRARRRGRSRPGRARPARRARRPSRRRPRSARRHPYGHSAAAAKTGSRTGWFALRFDAAASPRRPCTARRTALRGPRTPHARRPVRAEPRPHDAGAGVGEQQAGRLADQRRVRAVAVRAAPTTCRCRRTPPRSPS